MSAQASLLPDGRLHLHHGPIDLIIGVEGDDVDLCYRAAWQRFQTVLDGLVPELTHLRQPAQTGVHFKDAVAHKMQRATQPHAARFVTPMAAVAGAVADTVLAAMVKHGAPTKAYVNNGGDIAFHVQDDACFKALSAAGTLEIRASDPARGVATSGWQGRSHSLGIADSVTVLAHNAAAADVAATLIANAVDLPGHPAIRRRRAVDLAPDTDLGNRLVTVGVGHLKTTEIDHALTAGLYCAQAMQNRGLISQAVLMLQGQIRTVMPHADPALQGAFAHA